jgi:hypothetical protein
VAMVATEGTDTDDGHIEHSRIFGLVRTFFLLLTSTQPPANQSIHVQSRRSSQSRFSRLPNSPQSSETTFVPRSTGLWLQKTRAAALTAPSTLRTRGIVLSSNSSSLGALHRLPLALLVVSYFPPSILQRLAQQLRKVASLFIFVSYHVQSSALMLFHRRLHAAISRRFTQRKVSNRPESSATKSTKGVEASRSLLRPSVPTSKAIWELLQAISAELCPYAETRREGPKCCRILWLAAALRQKSYLQGQRLSDSGLQTFRLVV